MGGRTHIVRPAFLFASLPIAAAFLLAALPDVVTYGSPAISSPAYFLIASLVVCVLSLGTVSIVARKRKWTNGQPMLLVCIFLLIVGLGLYAFHLYLYPDVRYLLYIASVLVGVGGAFLMLLWGKAMSMLPGRELLANIATSFLLAGLLDIAVIIIPWSMDNTIVSVLFVLVSAFPLEHLFVSDTSTDDTIYDVFPARRRVAVAIWKPFSGVIVCLAIVACSWGTTLNVAEYSAMPSAFILRMVGITISGIILLILAFAFNGKHRYPLFIRSTPIISAVLLLGAWIVLFMGPSMTLLSNLLFGTACGLLSILTIRALAEISHEHDAALVLFGETGTILYTSMLVVFLIVRLLGGADEVVTPLLILAYLVIVNFNFGHETEAVEQTASVTSDSMGGLPEVVFDGAARTYHLTSAEREILPYLAGGHGSDYISDALSVSFDTVQARTRHIYDKLGVRTRGELITLMRRRAS